MTSPTSTRSPACTETVDTTPPKGARTLAAPKLTAGEASASISPYLTPDEGRLALIPTAGLNEVLTYEYLCQAENGEEVLVYLNADTGMEEQILILLRSDNGVLTR